MKLYIKKIVIERNGKVIHNYNFGNSVNIVPNCAEVGAIIKFLLGVPEPKGTPSNVKFFATVELDETYYICGKKDKGELLFTASTHKENQENDCSDEYFGLVERKPELDSSIFFYHFKKQNFPRKLLKYQDLLKYYPNGDFARLTNGYGLTRSFRGFITSYIKHFKPIRLCDNKDCFLKLSKKGEFEIGYLDNDEDVCLSASENILYHYLSFISVAQFWSRAEKIRNMHHVNKPLVVSNFLEYLDESIEISDILRCSEKAERQVFLFVNK